MARLISGVFKSIGWGKSIGWVISVVLVLCLGCEPKKNNDATSQDLPNATFQESKVENLGEAIRFLDNFSIDDRVKAVKEVGYQLNSWMVTDRNDVSSTKIPELVRSLPEDIRRYAPLSRVDSREFTAADAQYVMQSRLFASVAKWTSLASISDAIWKTWLQKPEVLGGKELSEVEISDLQMAYRFFDWTIRNIQLEGDVMDVEVLPKDPRLPLNDNALGYRQTPWLTMILGRGDFIERGRVFTELARQKNIPTVWLAVGKVDSLVPPSIWLIGVPIADEIFLFDSKLGIPIPGPNQVGIATLRQVQQDESILQRLSLTGRFKYALDFPGAQEVIALIETDPSMITGRMKRLQESLTSDLRTELYVDVDALAERIRKLPKIQRVQGWSLSVMTRMYAEELEQRLKENNEFTARYIKRNLLYFDKTPLIKAKYQHLMGRWENSLDQKGAMAEYMKCRKPEEDLAKLAYDSDLQKREFYIERLQNEPQEQFNFRIEQTINIYREAKIDATYLIGLLHYDQNSMDSSINWLVKRAPGLRGFERWQSNIWYNAARAYESRGELQQAIELLRKVPSPQEAGNRLRARLLQTIVGERVNASTEPTPGS